MKIKLDCVSLERNSDNNIKIEDIEVKNWHKDDEPKGVNRLLVSSPDLSVEIYPSKGFSVGEAFYKGRPLLWEPPLPIPKSEDLNLVSDEVCWNGKPDEGFTYIKTFTAGIEMLGLQNWGMHTRDKETGRMMPLHGEVHAIPVQKAEVEVTKDKVIISGNLQSNDYVDYEAQDWYLKGEPMYEVVKQVIIYRNQAKILLLDTIKNISPKNLKPDWGYHITFRPQTGSKYFIPSKEVLNRTGEPVPEDHEVWIPTNKAKTRTEYGIIHRKPLIENGLIEGSDGIPSVLQYPDGFMLQCSFTPAPYVQTWFNDGGAHAPEFSFKDGTPVLKKNWDAQGIEIGASSLDHNGNEDTSVQFKEILAPDESTQIKILIECVENREEQERILSAICDYKKDRIKK